MVTLFLAPGAFAEGKKNVLILNSYHQGYKWTDDETRGVIGALAPMQDDLTIYIEYMGAKWVGDDPYFEQLRHTMKQKFRNVGFDVIILSDNDALNFMVKYRDDIFGKVPTVFCGINYFTDDDLKGQPLYTGINETADIKGTLEIALRLHPSAKKVVLINDATTTGRRLHDELVKIKPAFQQKVRFEFLEDMEMEKLLERVEKLSPDSLIFYTLFFRDKAGKFYEYDESISLIAQRTKVPIYGTWDFSLGHGIIGGLLTSGYDQGRAAGQMALRILRGEKIENIPVVRQSPTRYMFDHKQTERFGIKSSSLPRESIFINAPASFYEIHKGIVWGILAGIIGLVLVVIILLLNIRRRKNAENELRKARDELETRVQERTSELLNTNIVLQKEIVEHEQVREALFESEQKLYSILQGSSIPSFVIDKSHKILYWNRALEALTGFASEGMVGTKQHWRAFYGEQRPCMADLLVDQAFESIPQWYTGKDSKSTLFEEAYNATDFFPELGEKGKWLHFTAAIIRNYQGDLVGAIETLEDVTERKAAEDQLRAAHHQLLDIIEFLPDATYVVDRDKKVIAWNRAIEEQTGVLKKDIIGKGDNVYTIPYYGDKRPNLIDLLLSDSEEIKRQYEYVERRGNAVCAEVYSPLVYGGRGACLFGMASPLYDSEGNIVGAIQSNRDITEQKFAEEKLKESQRQLADIINFLPDPTLVVDKESRVIAWNRAMEELTGIRASDMLGKGDYEYALPFYGKRRPILIDLVLKSDEQIETTYINIERKGLGLAGDSYTPALSGGRVIFGTASVLHDSKGNVVGAIESMRDITERRREKEALSQAEEKYRSIFENSIEGIFQTAPDGRILSANPAFARILGYDSPDELINTVTDMAQQAYVDPEHRSELLRLVDKQNIVREFEVQFFRKDSSLAWITLNVRAVRDDSGKLRYYEGTAQDVTDRKALELRLFQAQKMESIGTLAGGIAHDFNNILGAIIGYTEITKAKLQQAELKHYLEQVLKASDRARSLVAQILTFSRQADKEIKPLDISSLVKEALKLLRATLPSTIEIRHKITSELCAVLADPTQIHQVVMNLCTNAAHAMREKGGVLEVSLNNAEITPGMLPSYPDLKPGPYVNLTVRDMGTGIAPEIMERIFDPFFTTKKRGEGTGLGLSVVYGIVKECGGSVAVQSEPGMGSTFSVCLPAIEHGAQSAAAPSEALPRGRERIFFIDDEYFLVEIGREMLDTLGYEVVGATSSAEALEIFRAQPDRFDLVVTDMTMPGMTGVDLSKELLKIRPDIPIVLCTGFSELITGEEAKKLGISEFLMKPIALRNIAKVVRELLDGRKK